LLQKRSIACVLESALRHDDGRARRSRRVRFFSRTENPHDSAALRLTTTRHLPF
jgi:hypothetical protein